MKASTFTLFAIIYLAVTLSLLSSPLVASVYAGAFVLTAVKAATSLTLATAPVAKRSKAGRVSRVH